MPLARAIASIGDHGLIPLMYANMKELRFDAADGVWRAAIALDPERKAVILVAGDKSGKNEKKFYKKLINTAEISVTRHIWQRVGEEGEKVMAKSAEDIFAETMTPEMIEASDLRAKELFEEYDTLQKLRKALDLTQEHVGKKMGKKQVSVAQIEKRSDFLLSTLRDYVGALGGELELVVKFKDHDPVRLTGIGEKIFSEVPRRPSGSRGTAA